MNTLCPQVISGFPVDFEKGFDVINRKGEIVKNFKTLAEAEAFRKAEGRSYTTRFWVIMPEEEEES